MEKDRVWFTLYTREYRMVCAFASCSADQSWRRFFSQYSMRSYLLIFTVVSLRSFSIKRSCK